MPCAFRKNIPTTRPFTGTQETHVRMNVNCGKCVYCQSLIKRDWIFRFETEARHSDQSTCRMLTFTYKDSDFQYRKVLSPKATARARKMNDQAKQRAKNQLHFEDLSRTMNRVNKDSSGKWFAVSEYGSTTHRPHFHMLSWHYDPEHIQYEWEKNFGHVHITPSSYRQYAYAVNYLDKDEYKEIVAENPLFTGKPQGRRMSPGIGAQLLDTLTEDQIDAFLITGKLEVALEKGTRLNAPRYYRKKLQDKYGLTEEQRDKITADTLTRAHTDVSRKESEIMYKLRLTPKYYQIHLMKEDERIRKRKKQRTREYDQ